MKRFVVFLLSIAALLTGFGIAGAILGAAFQHFDRSALQQKIEYFTQHQDEYDTVFLGSSRVYHQISPRIFDELAGEAGVPTRSFNLGMNALFPPEDSYLAEYILSQRPKNLRWVFLEVSMFLPDWSEKNAETPRAIYWHDWTRTSMAVREIWYGAKKFEWKKRGERWEQWKALLSRSVTHVQMFARSFSNMGAGGGMLRDALKGKRGKVVKNSLERGRGYAPLGSSEDSAANTFRFDKRYAKRLRSPVAYSPLSPVGQENLDRILAKIREAGATPILLVSPVMSPIFHVPRVPVGELYLDFADVYTWSQLYQKEHFIDNSHLTRKGAELYTCYIVKEWLAGIRSRAAHSVAPPAPLPSAQAPQAQTP